MEKTKMKLLRVLDILKETDENHPLTANEICEKLQSYGIEAERKSVCRDINTLKEYYNNETEGDRLVGIISHLDELKEKIDKKIIISRDPQGSSICMQI